MSHNAIGFGWNPSKLTPTVRPAKFRPDPVDVATSITEQTVAAMIPISLNLLVQEAGWQVRRVLDIRAADHFARLHLAGAVSLPLVGRRLEAWTEADLAEAIPSIFLPPRHAPLLVVGDEPNLLQRVVDQLNGRGRARVSGLLVTEQALAGLPADLLGSGPGDDVLWSPSPFLSKWVDLLPPPAVGAVLDLACGSGRSSVWLAERGYRVTGIDWQEEALALGRRLAASRGTSCAFRRADLRDLSVVPAGPWSVVLNFRYLQRDLLARLAFWLKPGGVAVVRTFRDVPGYVGRPRRQHRLERGELLRCFPGGRFEILVHEESHDPDGRPAAGIVARRTWEPIT